MVCTGVFDNPQFPKIKDFDKYVGKKMHSRDYREANKFTGKNVLVIGAGRSASDLVLQISAVANVTSSQFPRPGETAEKRAIRLSEFGNAAIFKDGLERFTKDEVIFKDGTKAHFDMVIFATGYRFAYPFLNSGAGMAIEDHYVKPLYKQILNINHPTMAFIGVPIFAANNHMFDLEARFALEFITGRKRLPPKKEMLASMQNDFNSAPVKSKPHFLALDQKRYNNDLAETAGIENMKEVYSDILADQVRTFKMDPIGFRNYDYIIHDDGKTFDKVDIRQN
ncbi:senecionine N-oxygenase-like [Contarinia nasturtii]|uniref:senecionine N-oxygenase-like n=1 Tax=Contarinia nasturtii TaxID=265458 RepID=UPI0012D43CEC|nr:senecionine N-oxygenase-like [Contarinia nasturtii]XP_031624230.1 senecionine N-oxygenase-like [Contarinia nasturtii]XP_031624231.1 senecionine N-oxygenase-like [Contarinia nasturtii]